MQRKLKQVRNIVKFKIIKDWNLEFYSTRNEKEENLFYLAAHNVLTCKFYFKQGIFFLSYLIPNSFPTQMKRRSKQMQQLFLY